MEIQFGEIVLECLENLSGETDQFQRGLDDVIGQRGFVVIIVQRHSDERVDLHGVIVNQLQGLPFLLIRAVVEQHADRSDDHAQGTLELVGDIGEEVDLRLGLGDFPRFLQAFQLEFLPGIHVPDGQVQQPAGQQGIHQQGQDGSIPRASDPD